MQPNLLKVCSIAPILTLGYAGPMTALTKIVPSLRSVHICGSTQLTIWLGLALSGMFLTVINCGRVVFFNWPMKYIVLTRKYATGMCVVVVAVSLG